MQFVHIQCFLNRYVHTYSKRGVVDTGELLASTAQRMYVGTCSQMDTLNSSGTHASVSRSQVPSISSHCVLCTYFHSANFGLFIPVHCKRQLHSPHHTCGHSSNLARVILQKRYAFQYASNGKVICCTHSSQEVSVSLDTPTCGQ